MSLFVRCPYCRMPHESTVRVCPNTGTPLDPAAVKPAPRPAHVVSSAKAVTPVETTGGAPLEDPRAMLGRTLGGRYVLRDILGSGGMGTVFDAEHLGLKRAVAIKVLNPSQARKKTAVKRFQQEARAAGSIGHPNICEVYDLGALDDGSPYLVMEKLSGQTLAQRLQRDTRVPPDEVVEILIQALSGLGAAHDKGIVHRDIKPDNIFLAKRAGAPEIVKIVDFGVSKMIVRLEDDKTEDLDLTRTGMVMGTPYYMSPEQASGERKLDARVDLYACGVVMYEAVTGRRPFLASNYNALLLRIISGTHKPAHELLPSVPPAFEAVITRAMAMRRDDRYASAAEMQRDLLGLRASAVAVPKPPQRSRPAPEEVATIQKDPRRDAHNARDAHAARESREPREQPPPQSQRSAHQRFSPSISDLLPTPITQMDIPPDRPSGSIDVSFSETNSEVPTVDSNRPQDPRAQEWEDELPTEIFRPNGPPPPLQARAPRPQAWQAERDSQTVVQRPGIFDDDDDDDQARTQFDPRLHIDPKKPPPTRR